MEYVENIQRNPNDPIIYPKLEYEDYVPDDFIHAPNKDLIFHYSVTDPTGAYVPDYNDQLLVTDLVGYSIEDNGEYYWTYLAYREVYDGDYFVLNSPNMDLVGHYSSVEWRPLLPQSWGNQWELEIDGLNRDLVTGELTVIGHFRTNYSEYGIWYNEDTEEFETGIGKCHGLFWYENDSFIVNGEVLKYIGRADVDSIYYDEDGNYIEDSLDNKNFKFTLPREESYNDVVIEFISEDDHTDFYVPWIPGYIIASSKDQYEKIIIPAEQETFYDVSFINGLQNTVKVPFEYFMGEPSKFEEFRFTKLFDNKYEYPTTTTDLLKLEYFDGYSTKHPPLSSSSITANININGINFEDIKVRTRVDGDSIIFYIDEQMFYDQESEVVLIGESANELNENGIVLPWDSSSSGEITFTINLETHQTYTFNIQLEIGSNNPLRGDGGMYEIVEVDDEK